MNTGKAIRTLMILAAMGLFATGCVTAKQASQAASEGTQATPAPATTTTATATRLAQQQQQPQLNTPGVKHAWV